MRIVEGADEARQTILKRGLTSEAEVSAAQVVHDIIVDVRAQGDAAVRRHTEAFDGAIAYEGLEVPQSELNAALGRIEAELRAALEMAAGRIRRYHEKQLKRCLTSYVDEDGLGVVDAEV